MTDTLPWSWYSDAETLRLEQERIFRRAWQYAGHVGQVERPGDFFTAMAGDVPVVVVRARDGALNAFLNVCRHRGHELASGEGHRETLQCPYHAWTYDLDGSLRAAPRSECEAGFDRADLALRAVQVGTWGPFVFVNPDLDAPSLAGALGGLPDLVARLGLDFGALRFRERVHYALEANSKIACENFLECYHCLVAHPDFSKVVDIDPDRYALSADGLVGSQAAEFRDGSQRCNFHPIWPNTKLNVFQDQPNLSIGPLRPDGPGRTVGFFDYFFGPDVPEEDVLEFLAFDDQVGREDAALVESVHRGLRSGLLERGRLLSGSEQLIAHWQRLTCEALAR